MSVSLVAELMRTPGARRFLDDLAGDLAAGRSLLVLLPSGSEHLPLWETLRHELWRREFRWQDVWLPDLSQNGSPAAALGERLGVEWPSPRTSRTVDNLLRCAIGMEDFPEILYLGGFGNLTEERRRDWEAFLDQWTQIQHVSDDGGMSPSVCLMVPAVSVSSRTPESSVRLSVRWWWGMPSSLEMQLLCRFFEEGRDRVPQAQWREFQLPAIVGNDTALAEYLWDKVHLGFDVLTTYLRAFGNEIRDWTPEGLRSWGADVLLENPGEASGYRGIAPPQNWQALWARGVLWWTPEYGAEIHSSALAVLGKGEAISHRIWRGQTPILLPLIDRVRLALCGHLSMRFGEDWPVRWGAPPVPEEAAAVKKSPLACSWGHIEHLMRNCDSLRSERQWLPLVTLMRYVRNELAHYRPIFFGDFERLWRFIYQGRAGGGGLPLAGV